MGVTMHYTQYIYLTYNIYDLRKKNEFEINRQTFSAKFFNYFLIIFLYAIIMAGFSLFGKFENISKINNYTNNWSNASLLFRFSAMEI